MMLLLLTVAVLGDLVLLPALVVGPLGKLFERQHRRPTADDGGRTDAWQRASSSRRPHPARPPRPSSKKNDTTTAPAGRAIVSLEIINLNHAQLAASERLFNITTPPTFRAVIHYQA